MHREARPAPVLCESKPALILQAAYLLNSDLHPATKLRRQILTGLSRIMGECKFIQLHAVAFISKMFAL
ncbi:hypothetical protein A3709_15305 [Halioglobus sp. HI00S01]|nr:hypothetical protein A3709_15305 [Halioglobus sp. HI00S01]